MLLFRSIWIGSSVSSAVSMVTSSVVMVISVVFMDLMGWSTITGTAMEVVLNERSCFLFIQISLPAMT